MGWNVWWWIQAARASFNHSFTWKGLCFIPKVFSNYVFIFMGITPNVQYSFMIHTLECTFHIFLTITLVYYLILYGSYGWMYGGYCFNRLNLTGAAPICCVVKDTIKEFYSILFYHSMALLGKIIATSPKEIMFCWHWFVGSRILTSW